MRKSVTRFTILPHLFTLSNMQSNIDMTRRYIRQYSPRRLRLDTRPLFRRSRPLLRERNASERRRQDHGEVVQDHDHANGPGGDVQEPFCDEDAVVE